MRAPRVPHRATSPTGLESGRPSARRTVRTRLTITYTALMLSLCAVLVACVYLFMRFAPTYDFSEATVPSGATTGDAPANGGPEPSAVAAALKAPLQQPLVVNSARQLFMTLLIACAVAFVIVGGTAVIVGWFATGRMLKPLQAITTAVRSAGDGRLDYRIALDGPADELKALSDTFDWMLTRLERAFRAHERFAANASHELRTPLATTQAMLDVALASPDTVDVAGLAAKLREVNRQSIDTVDALLDLAEIAHRGLDGADVDLAPLIDRAIETVGHEAQEAHVSFTVSVGSGVVFGDPILLQRLIVNLVQNAVRHNVPGGSVTIATAESGRSVALRVANTGRIVPAELLPQLKEAFYRPDGRSSRAGARRGHGLGLALAATICEAHGARLDLEANPGGGLTVTAVLRRDAADLSGLAGSVREVTGTVGAPPGKR